MFVRAATVFFDDGNHSCLQDPKVTIDEVGMFLRQRPRGVLFG
jgi:hypothetical protein